MSRTHLLQTTLFPAVSDEVGPLSPALEHVVAILALIPLAKFVRPRSGQVGHPLAERQNLVCLSTRFGPL